MIHSLASNQIVQILWNKQFKVHKLEYILQQLIHCLELASKNDLKYMAFCELLIFQEIIYIRDHLIQLFIRPRTHAVPIGRILLN